ncbi:PepSY domain-containing protein [Jeotgalibaca sp. MA1X17-3]|uniref:PepSY domain-containing protein n=1 Tax=Jeotgalibaca sp. MA1X17-3 TaxID=2908211 RepID=UPI001F359CD9|nr:PepSY domain-containing protein [Jeotgalibaca sp. MA1X17-3]UJF16399.1 PepSY domain-containing protein [Jeotgalibaca sp. MA1X17-3]
MKLSKSKWGVLTVASSLLLMACGNTDTGTDDSMISTESSVSSMMSSEEMSSSSSMDSASISSEAISESTESESQVDIKGIENTTFDLSLQEAVDKFQDTFPNAKITSIAIDNDRDSYVYEVEGYNDSNSVEIKVDAYSGEIVKQKDTEDREDNAEDDVLDLEGIVSPQEAMKAALDEVASGYAKEWEIDSKNGQVYYEIDIEDAEQSNDDVHIDAKTGEFIGYD